MTRLLLLVVLLAGLALPAPRCRVASVTGRAYLVCPCRGVSYVCEDWYTVPVWRVKR